MRLVRMMQLRGLTKIRRRLRTVYSSSLMIRLVVTGFAALLGLAFGSFLNVCLTRWPEEESIVKPRSHCRQCGRTLAWWENVPVASWLALRGRCRTCKTWIGWRYPLVELAVGGLWALSVWVQLNSLHVLLELWKAHGLSNLLFDPIVASLTLLSVLGQMLFYWLLIALAILDAEHLWLPNWLTLPGAAAGLIVYIANLVLLVRIDAISGFPLTSGIEGIPYGVYGVLLRRLGGIAIAAAIVLVIRWTYWLFRKQEGMGLGDAKLMAMMAAWLGLPSAVLSFVLAVCAAAAFSLVILALPKARRGAKSWASTALPFGTFLCVAGVAAALWGGRMIDAYLRWSGLK